MRAKLSPLIALICLLSLPAQATPYGALRITAPNGQQSVLLGTMHLPYPGMVLPDAALLGHAHTYVIEHTTTDEQNRPRLAPEVMLGLQYDMDVVADWALPLSDGQIDLLVERFNCASPEKLTKEKFRMLLKLDDPRLVAQFAWMPCLTGQRQSRDQWLDELAARFKVPVVSLEAQEDVAARRRAVPVAVYQKDLLGALQGDLHAAYREVITAINRGDYDAAWASARVDSYSEDERRVVERVMVVERNAAWVKRLLPILNQGRAVVLVGVAHLPGPHGLVALLQARGYSVEPVTLQGTAAE